MGHKAYLKNIHNFIKKKKLKKNYLKQFLVFLRIWYWNTVVDIIV